MADFWKEDEPLPEEALLQDLAWADAVVGDRGFPKAGRQKELLVFTVQHTSSSCSGCRCAEPDCRRCRDSFGLPGRKILTPHVGELARLLHMTIAECQRDPAGSAGRAAEKYQACCVRKDSVTVTAEGRA